MSSALALAAALRLARADAPRPPPPAPPAGTATVAPPGFSAVDVKDLLEVKLDDGAGYAVILTTHGAKPGRVLPIFIGANEAMAIELRIERMRPPRPLTHDLLEALLAKLGGTVTKVHVEDLRDEVFYGRVFVKAADGKIVTLDARPSDALALAVGAGAPIFVAKHVLDSAAIDADKFSPGPDLDRLFKKRKEVMSL